MDFAGKVVLITGASAGIGAATALKFAEVGANLVIVGRNVEKLSKVAQSLEQFKVITLSIVADVSKDEDVKRIVDETIAKFARLDVLVNNAGIATRHGILDGVKFYDDLMAINMRAVYMLTSIAAPHIITTKGNIINVSSVASQMPTADSISYRVSKAALDMFTKCVALDLGPYGVRVNSVNPGYTKTNIFQAMGLSQEQSEAHFESGAIGAPLKRVSEANEIADMIVYIASNKARGMTGSITVVDNGGLLVGKQIRHKDDISN